MTVPLDLSPLAWYDAADLSAGALATWADASGNGHDATQSDGSKQYTVVANALNGLSVVRADGAARWMDIAANLIGNAGDKSIVAVVNPASLGYGGIVTSKPAGQDESPALDTGLGGYQVFLGTSASYFQVASTLTPQIVSTVRSGTANKAWIDGSLIAQNTSGGTVTPDSTTRIGTYRVEPSACYAGDIAELLIFPTALSDGDRQAVELYLWNKWFNPGPAMPAKPSLWLDASALSAGALATWPGAGGTPNGVGSGLVVANDKNGLPAVRLNGSSDYFKVPSLTLSDTMTLCVVSKCTDDILGLFVEHSPDAGSNLGFYFVGKYGSNGGGVWGNISRGGNLYLISPGAGLGTDWCQFSAAYNTTTSKLSVNGVLQSVTTSGGISSPGPTTQDLYIGCRGGNSIWTNGDIAELLIFPTALSDTVRQAVEAYLHTKWFEIPRHAPRRRAITIPAATEVPTLIQKTYAIGDTAISVTTPGIDTTAGNLLIATINTYNAVPLQITDSNNEDWQPASVPSSPGADGCYVHEYYAVAKSDCAGHTFTAGAGAINKYPVVSVSEWSGVDRTNPFDAAASPYASPGTPYQCPSVISSSAGALIHCSTAQGWIGTAPTLVGGDYTSELLHAAAGDNGFAIAYRVAGAAGSYSGAEFSTPGAGGEMCITVAYKAATAESLVGQNAICSSQSDRPPNYVLYTKFTAAESGVLQFVKVYANAVGGSLKAAVYSDASGVPGTKLGESSVITIATGWNTLPLTAEIPVTASTVYWLAHQLTADVANQFCYQAGGTNQYAAETTTWPDFPSTASPTGYADQDWSIYAGGTTSLVDFPVPIVFTDDADIGTYARMDGGDIRFSLADGTPLPYQLQAFTSAAGLATGYFIVKASPTTSPQAAWMTYGDSGLTDASTTAVWDAATKGAWSFGTPTSLSLADSTVNANTLTNNAATAAAGKIGGGASFTPTQYLHSSAETLKPRAGDWSISAWVYPRAVTSGAGVAGYQRYNAGPAEAGLTVSGGKFGAKIANGSAYDYIQGDDAISTNQWYHVALTRVGGLWTLYVNGVAQTQTTNISGDVNPGIDFYVGIATDTANIYPLDGIVDEVRVASFARSAAWVAYDWAAINSLITLGTAEAVPTFQPSGFIRSLIRPVGRQLIGISL